MDNDVQSQKVGLNSSTLPIFFKLCLETQEAIMGTRQVPCLSLEAAKVVAAAAEDKAKAMGMGMYLPFHNHREGL